MAHTLPLKEIGSYYYYAYPASLHHVHENRTIVRLAGAWSISEYRDIRFLLRKHNFNTIYVEPPLSL
jgi:hypothetical protein